MEDKDVRIKIDANGQVHRQAIDQPQCERCKTSILKRIIAFLVPRVATHEDR